MKPSEPAPKDSVKPVLDMLDRWAEALPPSQRRQLAAARAKAMAASASPRRSTVPSRWMGSALAAGVLLALGLSFWPHPVSRTALPQHEAAVASSAAPSSDDAQQDEDLDLLLLVSSDDAS